MTHGSPDVLMVRWLIAKEQERIAQEERRRVEDELRAAFCVPDDLDGTDRHMVGAYEVKIVGRISRKVDGDKLQELAAEAGLEQHLSALFRWKPEINKTAWDRADPTITKALSGAITAEPGRPSFTISNKKER